MADVTQADLERVRSEAGKALGKHEKECAERYGDIRVDQSEIRKDLVVIKTHSERNLKLLYVLLAGMLAVAARSFWPAVLGG